MIVVLLSFLQKDIRLANHVAYWLFVWHCSQPCWCVSVCFNWCIWLTWLLTGEYVTYFAAFSCICCKGPSLFPSLAFCATFHFCWMWWLSISPGNVFKMLLVEKHQLLYTSQRCNLSTRSCLVYYHLLCWLFTAGQMTLCKPEMVWCILQAVCVWWATINTGSIQIKLK